MASHGWRRQIHAHREAEAKERQAEMELLSADPFDPEAQARIAERIRQAQVEENYQNAYEYMPESFSQVTMLYVDMEVRSVYRPACHRFSGPLSRTDKRASP